MNVAKLGLFDGIDSELVQQISDAGTTSTFKNDETIFSKGDSAQTLYILEQGDIDLSVKDARHAAFNLSKPGEVFGWSSLAENGVYATTATCRSMATVRCISKADIDPILKKNNKAAALLYRRLGEHLSRQMLKVVQ